MVITFYYLLSLGFLGLIDIAYYHTYLCDLENNKDSSREVLIHKLRYLVYAILFLYVPNFKAHGYWVLIPALFLLLDLIITIFDALEEPYSRKKIGGIPRGEYVLHILYALVLGGFYHSFISVLFRNFFHQSTFLIQPPNVPLILRIIMICMSIISMTLIYLPIKIPMPLFRLFALFSNNRKDRN